jgi:hypothetical protein
VSLVLRTVDRPAAWPVERRSRSYPQWTERHCVPTRGLILRTSSATPCRGPRRRPTGAGRPARQPAGPVRPWPCQLAEAGQVARRPGARRRSAAEPGLCISSACSGQMPSRCSGVTRGIPCSHGQTRPARSPYDPLPALAVSVKYRHHQCANLRGPARQPRVATGGRPARRRPRRAFATPRGASVTAPLRRPELRGGTPVNTPTRSPRRPCRRAALQCICGSPAQSCTDIAPVLQRGLVSGAKASNDPVAAGRIGRHGIDS